MPGQVKDPKSQTSKVIRVHTSRTSVQLMLPLGVPILETRGPAIVDMEGVPTISTAATPFETRSSRKTIDLVATPRQDLGTPQKILDKTNTIRVESPRIEVRLPRTSPKMAVEEEVGGKHRN